MIIDNWAIPFTDLDGRLLGVEIKSHVHTNGVTHITGMEEYVEADQLRVIEGKASWFLTNNLFCITTSDVGIHQNLPFMRYMTNKQKNHEYQWLDELGEHGGSAIPLVSGNFEVTRLNKRHVKENIGRLIFPVLIKSIRQYCDRVIVPVEDMAYHQMLREAGIWAVQGHYKPIRFDKCENLI